MDKIKDEHAEIMKKIEKLKEILSNQDLEIFIINL